MFFYLCGDLGLEGLGVWWGEKFQDVGLRGACICRYSYLQCIC